MVIYNQKLYLHLCGKNHSHSIVNDPWQFSIGAGRSMVTSVSTIKNTMTKNS